MLVELLKYLEHKMSPPPPAEFTDFIQHAREGDNSQIPSFGCDGIFNYYGIDKNGQEQGRYRIPLGEVERSFHIQRTADGTFQVTDEGLFPYDGK